MSALQPNIGDWYSLRSGASFEVVAYDADDGTVEIQHFDGTIEEMDIEDWDAQSEEGALVEVDPPEDWSGSVDADIDDEPRGSDNYEERNGQWASSGLDGLDIFD